MTAPIRALFCDLDETLIQDKKSAEYSLDRAIPRLLERHPQLTDPEVRAVFRRINNWHWQNFDESPIYGMQCPFETRALIWNETLIELGVEDDELARRCAEAFQQARLESFECYDDTVETLRTLKGTIPIVLVTNGNLAMQRSKIERCGLEPWLDHIFIGQEVGVSKPKPPIFERAIEAVGREPQECLMVGDNLEKDIQGGKAAGLQTAWILRLDGNAPKPSDPTADYVVHSMTEVREIIASS